MTHKFDSIAEGKAAPTIAALGGTYHDTFAPLLPQTYEDAEGAELRGKPDYLIRRGGGYVFLDTKSGVLNNHHTEAESTTALRKAFGQVFGRCGDHLHQAALANSLYEKDKRGRLASLENSWHNSLFKVAALQALHGWQRYLIVFDQNPTGRDAARYCAAGLVWCTTATLYDLLNTIELLRHGWVIPFVLKARNYSVMVTPESGSKGLSSSDVTFIDRGRYLAAVAADRKAIATSKARDAADLAGGLLPF